ncbi:MAG: aromatic ring-hydroxylating dioxygenase subunit alpha [Chloroflexi bacterium]|nr:aromatic ring-hydroxylating dioxygenase subunit alpha [Chloroflexota bacterium]
MSQKNRKVRYADLYPKQFTAADFVKSETYKHTRAGVESALTIIPEAYTDERFYEIEQKRVFGNSWVPVAITAQVQKPGDVKVVEVAGQSIILTRNKEGVLRAFYNVCRHRGAMMLDKECTAVRGARIRCPYHSWAYDLDGNNIGTPLFEGSNIPEEMQGAFSMGSVDKFSREDYPLFGVHVAEWAFLIFVNLAEEPTPLMEQLGDLPEKLAPYRLAEWVVCREAEFIFKANYKLVGENFMEYYHLPWVHPELIKVSRMEDQYRWQGKGMYTGMMTWPISASEDGGWLGLPPMSGLEGQYLESARFIWLFPNASISVMPNHTFVMIARPDGPAHTVEETYILVHPESLAAEGAETELDQLTDFWTLVNNQDIDIVEKVQAGLTMRPYRGGRMCYHFEEPLHRYQNMVIDKMVGIERVPEGDGVESRRMFEE